jgi:hypothetical protein
LRNSDFVSGRIRREEALKQEKSSENVQQTYNYGCVPEREFQPP